MQTIIKLLLAPFLIGLIANAVLVVLSSIRDTLIEEKSPHDQTNTADNCCRVMCRKKEDIRLTRAINYTELAKKLPNLDPSYHSTMVRLGADLNFDFNQCPSGSYMPNKRKDFTPKHLNCPTLFVVGARKAGTSSLYQYVSKHPDFEGTRLDAGPKVGETYYFTARYESSTWPWEKYIRLFPSGGRMTGDSSVGNLVHRLTPKRLYDTCGKQAKIVMLFRDPIWRLESNFLMRARFSSARVSNWTSISTIVKIHLARFFDEVLRRTTNVKKLPSEWKKLVGLFDPAANMVFEGLYYVHLLNWLCNFPAENILIINSEELYRNSSKILDIVLQFLGLKQLDNETYDWITLANYNKGKYDVPEYQRLSRKDIVTLLGVYKPFNKELLELLQWKDSQWLIDSPY